MNLEQIQYLCAIYETGSINQAAKRLYLSQPNISNAIRKLEQEVGFNIIIRSTSGVQFTEKGENLIRHAKRIAEECELIQRMSSKASVQHFRVLTPNYPPAENAFVSLCSTLGQSNQFPCYRLEISQTVWTESVRRVGAKQADLAVIALPEGNTTTLSFQKLLKENGLTFHPLASSPSYVKLSKQHPLLQYDPFPFERLCEYPLTYYSHAKSDFPWNGMKYLPFTATPYKIYVDTGSTRSKIIANGTAWGISAKLPQEALDRDGVAIVEIPDCNTTIGYLLQENRPENPLEDTYICLLRLELAFLDPYDPSLQSPG